MPFDVTGKDAVQRLFKPLGNNKRLLCLLSYSADEDGKESYTLMYEYMGRHIPLLKTDGITRKGIKVTTAIRPAFSTSKAIDSAGTNEMWASPAQQNDPSSSQTDKWKLIRQRFLRRVRPSSQSVMDTPPADAVANTAAAAKPLVPPEPVLAKIKGNMLTNRYHFSSSLHDNSNLGDLDIYTHYVRCEPRKLTLTLTDSTVQRTMISKRPEWNPAYGIFELDFGGRICKDSVKNYQFEHREQVVRMRSKKIILCQR